ncbi:Aste57867_16345 [Aphanomyces stellatus]|uniref:Aste57867_16345 protein n=1 Tax=Aphanomyces stellatus TaxID=120398 RepID=A0A485L670_9STRA|nr:hypothetical protein As57867_016288 [Aphanomyces stellatus]VFT93121.1 Aste57867_16345 [Aphanomyces stellatus]
MTTAAASTAAPASPKINNHAAIAAAELKPKAQWTPDAARGSCYICQKQFGTLRRRHHCRVCGEVVCADCMSLKPVAHSAAREQQVKVCFWCPQRTRNQSRDSIQMQSQMQQWAQQSRRRATVAGCVAAAVDDTTTSQRRSSFSAQWARWWSSASPTATTTIVDTGSSRSL